MYDILDYVTWRGDLTFQERQLNVIDILILSQFALFDFTDILNTQEEKLTIKEFRDKMYQLKRERVPVSLLAPKDMKGLMDLCAKSVRFKDIVFHDRIDIIDKDKDMQFSAMIADVGDDRVVMYSGTGDKIVAWKEDLSFMYLSSTPSQVIATKYLNDNAKNCKGKLYLCGHSKGGNLTMYTAIRSNQKTQNKIAYCYSFDGPGLSQENGTALLNSPIYDKIVNIVPKGSIVGRLFEHTERVKIVDSNETGLLQHDVFNWHIEGEDFKYLKVFDEYSNSINDLVNKIIDKMDYEKRKHFNDVFFDILYKTGAENLIELPSKSKELAISLKNLKGEDRKLVLETLSQLFSERNARKILLDNIKDILITSNKNIKNSQ